MVGVVWDLSEEIDLVAWREGYAVSGEGFGLHSAE